MRYGMDSLYKDNEHICDIKILNLAIGDEGLVIGKSDPRFLLEFRTDPPVSLNYALGIWYEWRSHHWGNHKIQIVERNTNGNICTFKALIAS